MKIDEIKDQEYWKLKKDQEYWKLKWERKEKSSFIIPAPEPEWLATDLLLYLPGEGKILEAGCGLGKWVFFLLKNGYDIHGIDYVQDVIEKNKKMCGETRICEPERFSVGNVQKLEFPDSSFDGYISLGVIEHYHDPSPILKEAHRVLKTGGIMFLTVPNQLSPYWWHYLLSYHFSKNMIYHRCMSRFFLRRLIIPFGFKCIASHNRDVPSAFRHGFWLDRKTVKGLPNPFYYISEPIKFLGKITDRIFPFMGYISVFVGQKI